MNLKARLQGEIQNFRRLFTPKRLILLMLGTAILSFGLYNIHRRVGITEGGVLGMVLLLDHHFGLPPYLATPILTACATCWGGGF